MKPNKRNDLSRYKVLILAAGLGTRLRPLTNTIPKVMVPIYKDHPLLEHTLCLLRDQGFREFIINLHYFPEKIVSYFGDGRRFGVHIVYSDESKQLLETGGAIKKIAHLLSDNFLLVYADSVCFFSFPPAVEFHQQHRALATIVLGRSGVPQDGDMAEVDHATQRIVKWHQRPHQIHEYGDKFFWNAGLYVLSKKIADYIPAGKPVKLDIEVVPRLVREERGVFGFLTSEPVLDIGTPEKYERAKEWYMQSEKRSPLFVDA